MAPASGAAGSDESKAITVGAVAEGVAVTCDGGRLLPAALALGLALALAPVDKLAVKEALGATVALALPLELPVTPGVPELVGEKSDEADAPTEAEEDAVGANAANSAGMFG